MMRGAGSATVRFHADPKRRVHGEVFPGPSTLRRFHHDHDRRDSDVSSRLDADDAFDEAQLAAAAFLARYSGRTLDAYRHDLRGFLQWSAEVGVTVLAATRPHIELYRGWMEDRGSAASTIDR